MTSANSKNYIPIECLSLHLKGETMSHTDDLAKEISDLKAALEKYGDCTDYCACRWTIDDPKWHPCDCGYRKALKDTK